MPRLFRSGFSEDKNGTITLRMTDTAVPTQDDIDDLSKKYNGWVWVGANTVTITPFTVGQTRLEDEAVRGYDADINC